MKRSHALHTACTLHPPSFSLFASPLEHHLKISIRSAEFEDVEDALLQITRREASWGGMLSSATPAAGGQSATSAPANGSVSSGNGGGGVSGMGTINGRTAASKSSAAAAAGRGGGMGALNGGAGGENLAGTRTLV